MKGGEKALNYCKEAMQLMEKLGTRNQKITTLVTKEKAILKKERCCFGKRISFATVR